MDEPLSNLDAKLRVQMRTEISDLHRRLQATFVFVTHDQAEAMTMSDRVAVMMTGELVQVGTPDELYHDPRDLRVAEFIGSPKINVLPVELLGQDTRNLCSALPGAATLAFRPEATELAAPVIGALSGRIGAIENLGSDIFLHVTLTAAQDAQPVIIRVAPSRRFAIGDEVGIHPDPARVLQFDAAGRRLRARERVAA
jgi:multiple sugar transport system ATP-binding protein